MSRSERLFDLLHALRGHRRPVSGQALADQLGVSIRTLYRDIASLQALGADVAGEPGVGYVLRPGFLLPPLMFPPEEIEALVLGARWVADRGDARLRAAAQGAVARIGGVLPAELREELEAASLLVAKGPTPLPELVDPALLRQAIRSERKLRIAYRDAEDRVSDRVVWPFAIGFFDRARMLAAWCELREDFRHFRTDRIETAELLDARSPRRRRALLQAWRAQTGIREATV